METFKAYLLIVGFIGALGFGGYWAATSLQDPVRVVNTDEIKVVAQTPIQTISQNQNETSVSTPTVVENLNTQEDSVEIPASTSNSTHADLISQLQKLIDDVVLMKEGSRGTRVGTVQEFLNIYNKTSSGVDNDYGPGTKTKVAAFQKAVGLTADGQAGPDTYKKMIEWLNNA